MLLQYPLVTTLLYDPAIAPSYYISPSYYRRSVTSWAAMNPAIAPSYYMLWLYNNQLLVIRYLIFFKTTAQLRPNYGPTTAPLRPHYYTALVYYNSHFTLHVPARQTPLLQNLPSGRDRYLSAAVRKTLHWLTGVSLQHCLHCGGTLVGVCTQCRCRKVLNFTTLQQNVGYRRCYQRKCFDRELIKIKT